MQGIEEAEALKLLDNEKLRNEYHFDSLDDLFVMVSGKSPAPSAILAFLRVKKKLSPTARLSKGKPQAQEDKCPVEVPGGVTGLAISLGQCCTPIPGDKIVGYITKGKGITVHRINCPNIARAGNRTIDLQWKADLGLSVYPVDIEVFANDRPNLVSDILQTCAAKGVGVRDLKAHLVTETMNDVIDLTMAVTSAKQLGDVCADIMGLKGVYSVNRVTH